MSVFIYHNCKATSDDLLKYDVVLTTYGTLAQEVTRREKFEEENNGRSINYQDKTFAAKFPLLNPEKAKFHRVILDEAQCIKNRNTKTARAAHQLQATYRWCLTGTPMMNGVKELYSLIKFLRIKPYCKWEEFSKAFGQLMGLRGDPKSVAMDRLRALLKAVMLRRKKDSKLDGKPILELPPKTERIVYAELSTDERDFYRQLEQKAQVQFSKYLREGSVGKNYSSILVLLLRLRQACCHPHLNLDVDDAAPPVTEADLEKLVKELDGAIVERIKGIEAFECPICYDAVQAPLFIIPCGHDSCKDCLARISDAAVSSNIQEGSESHGVKCPVCRGLFDPKKCFGYDLFKAIHMADTLSVAEGMAAEQSGDEDGDDSDSESADESEVDKDDVDSKGNLKGFIVPDSDGDDDDDNLQDLGELAKQSAQESKIQRRPKGERRSNKKKSGKKGKGKAADVKPSMLKSLRHEANKNKRAYDLYIKYLRKTWMPAAKVTECINLLKNISESGAKTIVFSQWTLLLDLLEVAMWHDKMPEPVRYDGSMSGEQRSSASKRFQETFSARVMLVSLRAGNAGLNLTAATRVVIMDPFWNPYIEMQAIDRAYRIGQQKEVEVYRILTRETVEDRIVDLQTRKKEIVEAALDEAEGMKISRLNERDLRFLFNT